MSVKEAIRLFWVDAILLIFALAPPILSAWLSYRFGEADWFQRSGSLMVLFAAILEFRQVIMEKNVRSAAWGAAKRRAAAGTAIVGPLPGPRMFFAALALILVILGTIIWGYGHREDRGGGGAGG